MTKKQNKDINLLIELMPWLFLVINKFIKEERLSEEEALKKMYGTSKFKFPSISCDYFVKACKHAKKHGWNEQQIFN